jgi:hypothetical protein
MKTRGSRRADRARWLAAAIVLSGAASGEREAVAAGSNEREQCATSAEQAQQLRDDGNYRRAREQMLFCARPTCPVPIKTDCSKWLGELDRDAPTVVFGARDGAGGDLLDVKVSMDGVPIIHDRLDGKPVLVDAGEHTFRFESSAGVRETRVLVRTGEKARSVVVTFAPEEDAKPAAAPSPAPSPQKEAADWRAPVIALGAVGVVALGSFAFFGLTGRSEYDDLQRCKPNCKPEDVDSTRTKLLVADVSLGVSVVSLGIAAYMVLTRPSVEAPAHARRVRRAPYASVHFDALPMPDGGLAGFSGAF